MTDNNNMNSMNRIRYTFTNKAKIMFFVTVMLLFLLRFIITLQIKFYGIDGYTVYITPTLIYYGIIFLAIIIIFFCYKCFITTYDSNEIVYTNYLLRRSRRISVDEVRYALLDWKGIHLRRSADEGEPDALTIPFFRGGVINPFDADKFFRMLLSNKNIKVTKTFKTLPGYTKKWRWVSIIYAILAICTLLASANYLYTVIVLFTAAGNGAI